MRATFPNPVRTRRRRVLIAFGGHDHQLYRGARRYASQAGWILDANPAHYAVLPAHWQGEGILTLVYPDSTELIAYLRDTKANVVNLGDDVAIGDGWVLLDNEAIGRMAAEHLLERGLRHFAFLKFANFNDVLGREKGFTDRLAQDGFSVTSLSWPDRKRASAKDWHEWLCASLKNLPTPLGILAQNDNRAVSLLDACEAIGRRVPEQVAVVGVDNKEEICTLAPIPISSIASNRERLAFEGAALLDRLMNGEAAPAKTLLIPPKAVIVRQSTNILAIKHEAISSALNMISTRYAEPITVDEVVAASHMSRSELYRAFEKHLGRSIGDEIEQRRVQQAKRLLVETDEKLHHIATLSGFSNGEHLSRAFRRIVGTSPSAFRKERQRPTQ
jgi:LacI family transcriptional regulator